MANPALMDRRIRQLPSTDTGPRMTHGGVAKALGIFTAFLLAGAYFGWHEGAGGNVTSQTNTTMLISIIVALVLSFVIQAKPRLARDIGVLYAVLEGFALGIISAVYNAQYHGIVLEAIGCTLGVALCVWFLYGTGIIKVTAKVTRVITMAVLGALAFYALALLSMAFGGTNLISSGGPLGIVISLVLAVIAASTFLLDFDRIDRMIAMKVEASYNWYGAFGLLISIIWLYLEILNIMGRLRGGRIR